MSDLKFQFGNIVVVEDVQIGVIVKAWSDATYEVYVRNYRGVSEYPESDIKHFIYSKTLPAEDLEFYG